MAFPEPTAIVPEWTVGERMKKARTTAGLTVEFMAEQFGVKVPTIRSWEQSVRAPRQLLDRLREWARVTGVSYVWLLGAEYAVITPTLRLITTTAPQMSDSYERIQPERNEGRGPWKASLRILNGARNGDSDPSTCGYSERRSCA
jgi:transcriptional regulator with XRE-family HTH domain